VALTHLIDTSVLKRLAVHEVRAAVEQLVESGRLGRATISDLEVGYSARNVREWDRLVEALDVFDEVRVTAEHFVRALQVQRLLASRSQRGRMIPDLLIAAVAEAQKLVVLHYDHDFDEISKVTGQSCAWVVPRGSVD
jgi:predicted nucleic acid-binding protein